MLYSKCLTDSFRLSVCQWFVDTFHDDKWPQKVAGQGDIESSKLDSLKILNASVDFTSQSHPLDCLELVQVVVNEKGI